MSIKNPIYWHQGMFLQPQHFQLTDMHARFRLKPFVEVGLPYFWGVGKLIINEIALANRIFEVQATEVLFKDGTCTYLEFPGNAVLRSRSFSSAWQDLSKPFMVYFALKKLSLIESNVATASDLEEGAEMNTRCVTALHQTTSVPDLHSDGPAAEIKTLNFVIRVLWESELEKFTDYDVIPVAVLEYSSDGIRIAPNFIPPCYALSASTCLYDTVKVIYNYIAARAYHLEQYKNPREMQKSEFDLSYMTFLLALRTLNRYAVVLHHYLESPQVHPWEIYGLLRQLIAELSSFSERSNMLGEFKDGTRSLPGYKHHQLGDCFFVASVLVKQLLDEIVVGPELFALFESREDYLVADLPERFFATHHRYYLILRSEMNPEDFLKYFFASAKLATLNDLPIYIRRALPGIDLAHMPVTPQGLPRRTYSFYFRIETACEIWQRVEQQGNLAFDWPDAPADLKAELVVLS